jgi:acetyltransferase-like isoleucine patch superfamily enzyme
MIHETARLFNVDYVKDSVIGKECIVGERSRIINSKILNGVRIDRDNFIMNSIVDYYTYTGQWTKIYNSRIGKYCSISWSCTIGPANHDFTKFTTHDIFYNNNGIIDDYGFEGYDRFKDDVIIGDDVWIGCNSTVLRGVSIGTGAVIGANSVVTKSVPPYAIYAGIPAKLIKMRFEPDLCERLEQSRWWDLPRETIVQLIMEFGDSDINKVIKKIEDMHK